MKLSLRQQCEIRQLLATGRRDQVVRRYREFTGCDMETALAEVNAFASVDEAKDELPTDRFVVSESISSGSAWTLIAAIVVFVAILGTVYLYLFPRLQGEYVSSTSMLEFRAIKPMEEPGDVSFTLPDDSKVIAEKHSLLSASDFSVFNGDAFQHPPLLTLHFSDSGRERLRSPDVMAEKELVIILNGRAIALTRPAEWTETSVVIELPGLSSSAVNEIFARLTQ